MNGRQVVVAARAFRPDLKVLFDAGYVETAAVVNGRLDPRDEGRPRRCINAANAILAPCKINGQ